ncbi:MAG TPA: hypothetical protein VKV25_08260 [Acidimicrobiales bacterium]|nr:hypothetical protein [Acidimicrobiales bacterium]
MVDEVVVLVEDELEAGVVVVEVDGKVDVDVDVLDGDVLDVDGLDVVVVDRRGGVVVLVLGVELGLVVRGAAGDLLIPELPVVELDAAPGVCR